MSRFKATTKLRQIEVLASSVTQYTATDRIPGRTREILSLANKAAHLIHQLDDVSEPCPCVTCILECTL